MPGALAAAGGLGIVGVRAVRCRHDRPPLRHCRQLLLYQS